MLCTENEKAVVAELIGRSPRGLKEISVKDKGGVPVVIRVAPLVDDKPFPTLFWLVDKRLNYAIDQLEAGGLIAEFQAKIDSSDELQRQLVADHKAHIALRQTFFSDEERESLAALGYSKVFLERGIGGIADFQRIRCLHTYYASHLIVSNAVGRLLDDYWCAKGVSFDHLI